MDCDVQRASLMPPVNHGATHEQRALSALELSVKVHGEQSISLGRILDEQNIVTSKVQSVFSSRSQMVSHHPNNIKIMNTLKRQICPCIYSVHLIGRLFFIPNYL